MLNLHHRGVDIGHLVLNKPKTENIKLKVIPLIFLQKQ